MLARSPPAWFNLGEEESLTTQLADAGAGERLDRFELIAELASGGMATVFLARVSGAFGFQRLFAIKRLHPHLARETEFVEMFLDEARLAAHIHHPNVVPILEVGQSERGYYLVMDYVEGDTFARMISRAAQAGVALPFGVVVRVMMDAMAGLHAAHELRDEMGQSLELVHRDVSPQNVLVGVDGIARLLDFGVARATARLATTRTGQLKGKLAYMAPEQARGLPVDRRADLFASGVVLWEALAMKRLFRGEGEAETLHRVLNEPILPPSSIRPEVPKALDAICMRALERDPAQRYASAQELADDLERAGRALSCIGSVRDVAECLQQAVGSELSQQREAVRVWLTRSEPSGMAQAVPKPPQSVTRVEGQREGSASQSGPRPEVTQAMAPPSSRRELAPHPSWGTPFTPSHGVSAVGPGPHAANARPSPGSMPPERVSSVSSAVLPLVEMTGQANASGTQSASGGARGAVAAVAVFLLLAAGGGVYGARRLAAGRAHAPAPTAPVAVAVTSAAAPVTSAAAPEPVPSASPAPLPAPEVSVSASASSAPVASSTKPPSAAAPARRPGKVRPVPGASSGPGATPAVPDDLSNNPYR